jgi:hypothetical protein
VALKGALEASHLQRRPFDHSANTLIPALPPSRRKGRYF